jgi:5-methyltetrahydrofolate--homocysteine methyltransferase
MRNNPLDACRQRVLIGDGAMGTQLFIRGMTPGECGMKWNEDRPDEVGAVHSAYADAGCDFITTNSFGGSSSMLARHGYADQVAEWNRRAAELARAAAGDDRWVWADIGPFGDFLEPVGDMTESELEPIFAAQIAALLAGGADAVLIETMVDPGEVAVAIRAAKSISNGPVAATYAFNKTGDGFRTIMGTSAADAVRAALDAGAQIVGANCGTDLSLGDYVALAEALVKAAGDAPVMLQPNAGAPKQGPSGIFYDASPADFAEAAKRICAAGVRIIGGCCGTTPDHLRAVVEAVK